MKEFEFIYIDEIGVTPFDISNHNVSNIYLSKGVNPFSNEYLETIKYSNYLFYNYLASVVGYRSITKCDHDALMHKYYSLMWSRNNKERKRQNYLKNRNFNKIKYADKTNKIHINNPNELYKLKYMQWFTYECVECGTLVEKQFRLNRIEQYKPLLCQKCLFNKNYDFIKASEKRKQFYIDNYGVTNPMHLKENVDKTNKKYRYNDGTTFNSSWELAVWIYHVDQGVSISREPCGYEYYFNNVKHVYFPDFNINGKLVEIKGSHFFKDGKMINPKDRTKDDLYNTKYIFSLSIGVEYWGYNQCKPFIDYVYKTYGKDYLKSFIITSGSQK